jgi:hypothetical protein
LIPKETLGLDTKANHTTVDIHPGSATMYGTNRCSTLLHPTEVREIMTAFEYTTPASETFGRHIYRPVRKCLQTIEIDAATGEANGDIIGYCVG